MSLRANVVANYFGQAIRALIGIAFIPLYIKFLGIEAYGLIAIFAVLLSWLVLLDAGMKPTLAREMARYLGGAHNTESIRDVLRTIEILALAIAVVIALGTWAASGWLASEWVTARTLPTDVVAQAFAVMGLVTALRFIESIYISSIAGLQRQVLQNAIATVLAIVQAVGAVAVLAWVSPTITAFFLWQGLTALVNVVLLGVLVYRILPSCARAARFSRTAVATIRHFATGMLAITFLLLLLTQVDKIVLSRLLTLEAYGYYALAGVMANAVYMLIIPINAAFLPRFTELATRDDETNLRFVYHQAAQLTTIIAGTAAITLIVFGYRVTRLWTGDDALAAQAAPLLAVLAAGTLTNGLMTIPYALQLAYGWTSLMIRVNIVAVFILIPAILWVVPRYGAIGAAWIWVALNLGYVLIAVPLMHRRLLRGEEWRWYFQDLAGPLAAAVVSALACRFLIPDGSSKTAEFSALVASAGCVLIATALAAPATRRQLGQIGLRRIRSLTARTA